MPFHTLHAKAITRALSLVVPIALGCAHGQSPSLGLSNPAGMAQVPISLGPEVAIRARGCAEVRYASRGAFRASRTLRETTNWLGTTSEGEDAPDEGGLDGVAVRNATLTISASYQGASAWVPRARSEQGSALAFLSTLVGAVAGEPTSNTFVGTIAVAGERVAPQSQGECVTDSREGVTP